MFVRPIRRFVLLLDEQPEMTEGGVVVRRERGVGRHDFPVVRVGEAEDVDFGQGDVAVLADPNAGRRLMLDGIVYRLVRVSDVIAVVEAAEANNGDRTMENKKPFVFQYRKEKTCQLCRRPKMMLRMQKTCDECREHLKKGELPEQKGTE